MNRYRLGQLVRIVGNSRGTYRNKNLIGEIGTVLGSAYDPRYKTVLYGVQLPGMRNAYSCSGGFWFLARDMQAVCEKEERLKEENTMLPGYKTASIQFLEGHNKEKTYFYALYDEAIAVNDTVIVSTGHHGLALAIVVGIGGPASYVTDNREIVCKVDLTPWEGRKEKAQAIQQLKEDMDERVKAYQAVALYELAAEKDPELKAMLDRFKALQEG